MRVQNGNRAFLAATVVKLWFRSSVWGNRQLRSPRPTIPLVVSNEGAIAARSASAQARPVPRCRRSPFAGVMFFRRQLKTGRRQVWKIKGIADQRMPSARIGGEVTGQNRASRSIAITADAPQPMACRFLPKA